MRQIVTKQQAISLGATRYFTGKSCKHGHISERMLSNRSCVTCSQVKREEYRVSHLKEESDRKNTWVAANRTQVNEQKSRWKRENPHLIALSSASRRTATKSRNPKWLTAEDKDLMAEIYKLAQFRSKCTGVKHHVDHVIPLMGKLASGLHSPWNMQILTATDNTLKYNKYEAA